uniref:Uncharacterized protein TCIL3000_8_2810 n=1 Tax=Trypanosoma congolense (strain IL3000) TaxID=1068625 RepID=G0URQ0_TRYCI|nr:unnamed protein product [Trypanosoma congolense IL3000]
MCWGTKHVGYYCTPSHTTPPRHMQRRIDFQSQSSPFAERKGLFYICRQLTSLILPLQWPLFDPAQWVWLSLGPIHWGPPMVPTHFVPQSWGLDSGCHRRPFRNQPCFLPQRPVIRMRPPLRAVGIPVRMLFPAPHSPPRTAVPASHPAWWLWNRFF